MPPRKKTTPTGRKISQPLGRPPETTVQIAKKANRPANYKGEEWREEFLDTLRTNPNVTVACKRARIARRTAYIHKEYDPEFSKNWDDAVEEGRDLVEAAMIDNAKLGNFKAQEYLITKWRYGQNVKKDDEGPKTVQVIWGKTSAPK